MAQTIARWTDWGGRGLDHLVLEEGPDGIVATSVVIDAESPGFAATYEIRCDNSWRVLSARVRVAGLDREAFVQSLTPGQWCDATGRELPELAGCIDVDITATPFTNTLPIRRLAMQPGDVAELKMVYFTLPELTVTADPQRYTCLGEGRYRFESLDSDFTRDIETDANGLVVLYPGLFRRVQ